MTLTRRRYEEQHAYASALTLCRNDSEREHLEGRLAQLGAPARLDAPSGRAEAQRLNPGGA
ncbi:hypothetical protein [Ornithinimicrobium sufpigmenti]|uniref:hypothetical protein n=1 Tax=Ornithinimicrobium sufpigmenti TaxID=2508882 RepID=UPI001036E54B|nr:MULTISPECIES: hypothetical protein [unclassified Ornithinimicrobium]